MHTPKHQTTLGEAPAWNELFMTHTPLNRDALLLTDVLDHVEIRQDRSVSLTFGEVRMHATHGSCGNPEKDAQIRKLSSVVMLKPGYAKSHPYIPPDLRQVIVASILLLDYVYKALYIGFHNERTSHPNQRMWQYAKEGGREIWTDELLQLLALEHHPFTRRGRVFWKEGGNNGLQPKRIDFPELELIRIYECKTFMTQTHRYGQRPGNMTHEEILRDRAVREDIQRTTSGEHIHKIKNTGTGIVPTGGLQRMDIIDEQEIPSMQLREEWRKKYAPFEKALTGKTPNPQNEGKVRVLDTRTDVAKALTSLTDK